MMDSKPSLTYCAVYDFELMPYALGDVLTWNIQTAIRAAEVGMVTVDVYICMDKRYPASIYQRGTITDKNCGLFFNELFPAFGTHPNLRSLFLFQDRDELLSALTKEAKTNEGAVEALEDYTAILSQVDDDQALNQYFIKYIYSHERINAYAERNKRIPLLTTSPGCEPDVTHLTEQLLRNKRIVMFHIRLRRLDAGYGGEHTHERDSDFLEWYDFLRRAEQTHPDVTFVTLGRLQEKPLALLKLPNVLNLRTLGMGLGHELTLMLKSHLFIGTSSGFAAMANFSSVPYFVTRMNPQSCQAYHIDEGATRLPFASSGQHLVYEPETSALLMKLLESGLPEPVEVVTESAEQTSWPRLINTRQWHGEHLGALPQGPTTSRFYTDDGYAANETAYLLKDKIEEVRAINASGDSASACELIARVEDNFPDLRDYLPELLCLKTELGVASQDWGAVKKSGRRLKELGLAKGAGPTIRYLIRPYISWAFPYLDQVFVWDPQTDTKKTYGTCQAHRKQKYDHMKRIVYTSHPIAPEGMSLTPWSIFRNLLIHKELISTYTAHEFSASYRGTILGLAWAVMSPLIMLTLFTVIFGFIFGSRFTQELSETPYDFALALFVGLSFFTCLTQSMGSAPSLIIANATFVKSLDFPLEILSVSSVLNILGTLLISLGLCLVAFLVMNGYIHATAVYLPLHVIAIAAASLGLSWFLSALGVFVRDVPSIVGPLTLILMFSSAIFFPLSMVPPRIKFVVELNPLAVIIDQARNCLLYGKPPDISLLITILCVSILFMMFGYWFFMKSKPRFADVL